ncbi:ERAD-associated protein [Tilletia horrida]|nr:ERAD-associated protein [Tilletia horrida]
METEAKQQRRRRRCRANAPGRPALLAVCGLLALVAGSTASASASAHTGPRPPVPRGQEAEQLAASFAKTYTSAQAYSRALYLLDSLVIHPAPIKPPPAGSGTRSGGGSSSSGASAAHGESRADHDDTRREYHSAHFDATQAWGPFGTFLRLAVHTRNTIREWVHASKDAADSNTAASYIADARKTGATAGADVGPNGRRSDEDEPLLYAASDGARPLQLWPWWEGKGDRAIAGPWVVPELEHEQLAGSHIFDPSAASSSSSSSALLGRLGSAILPSKRSRAKKGLKRTASSSSTASNAKLTPLQKAQRRRGEAIALLEWVAFGHVSPDYDALLQQSESLRPTPSAQAPLFSQLQMPNLAQRALTKALGRNKTHAAFRTSAHASSEQESGNEDVYAVRERITRSSALWVLAEHSLWGTHAASPHLPRAKAAYEVLAWTFGNGTAHSRLGFLEGSGWGRIGGPGIGSGQAWGVGLITPGRSETEAEEGLRQARALLHYELAASAPEPSSSSSNGVPLDDPSGLPSLTYSARSSAQMALGYRYLSGIGTPMDCLKALDWYEIAAKDAYSRFLSGPPKGLILPYTHMRLSDVQGGAYGPGASAASSGYAASRPQIQAVLESRAGSGAVGEEARIRDLLEYYEYQAEPILKASGLKGALDRKGRSGLGKKLAGAGGELGGGVRSTANAAMYAVELARFYHGGSLWAPGESAGRVERDFVRAREYALRVASRVWPLDAGEVRRGGPSGPAPRSTASASKPTGTLAAAGGAGSKQLLEGEDLTLAVKDEAILRANRAAAMLGWMYLRGEGVKQDFRRAWVWFARGSEAGDPDCHNGIGVMIRDGYGVKPNVDDAARYFAAASQSTHPSADGLVNMGRIQFDLKDFSGASHSFKKAMHFLDPFESYLWHGKIDAVLTRAQAKASASSTGAASTTGPSLQERCDSAVLNFKHAVERADWADPVFHRADRAWRRGDTQRALLGWMLAGELGYEAAQNNVAWILDRDKHRLQIPALDQPADDSFDRLALVQWTRSAGQENVDALVKMGDYYFRGIGTSTPGVPSYEKAVACYSAAADMSASALAYWNMGWMYETGLGVGQRDFHLAKRYYDMAWNTNRKEAYLAVVFSLVKLHARAAWAALAHGDASALAMFDSYARGLDTSMPLTEAEEEKARKMKSQAAERQKKKQQEEHTAADEPGSGDPYIPETYDRRPEAAQQQQQQHHYDHDDDGSWLDGVVGGGEGGAAGAATDAEAAYEYASDILDDLEGLLLVLAVGFLFFLVWYRRRIQMGQQQGADTPEERARRERIAAAREEFRARGEEVILPDDAAAGAAAGAAENPPAAGEGAGAGLGIDQPAGAAGAEGNEAERELLRQRRAFLLEDEDGDGDNPALFANAM